MMDVEEVRLSALRDLDLLDTPESEAFDRITRMASQLFDMPISAVSLTDRDRQWFKSHVGTAGREIPRLQAPCAAVAATRRSLLVPDMLENPDYADCTLTRAGVRFYAGAPLVTREGHGLGAMCVLDSRPRSISPAQMASLEDFAAMVMAQIELQHNFGRIDPLSGLPNRHQFIEDLKDLAQREPGRPHTAMLIDLADLRHLNHTVSVLGTGYLDELLRVSSRAVRQVLGGIRLYHVGLASYAAVLDDAAELSWRDALARLGAKLREPMLCNEIPVVVAAAYGLSPFRLGEVRPEDVLRTAISAANDAQEAELEYAVYSPASDEANRRRYTLLTDMRAALTAADQLNLVYQPRVDARSGGYVSAEALLRWRHPVLGNVSPGEFIPLVEQTALARPLTAWVIGAALDQAAAWRQMGCPLRISINVSAHNLEEEDFAPRLAEALRLRALPAEAVEMEFTESALIRDGDRVMAQLAKIRDMGVEIAIDDFGTGYSTFAYLKDIPASTVKLDQSFIRGVVADTRDQLLVTSMIAMAHGLGYRVVAEGVETADVRDFLAEAGCDELQGYFFSRPISAAALQALLTRNDADASSPA